MKSIVTLAAVLLFGWGAIAQDQDIPVVFDTPALELNCAVSQPCLYEDVLGVCVEQVNVTTNADGTGYMHVFERYQHARGLEVFTIYRTFEQERSILFDTKEFDSLSDTWLVVWGGDYSGATSTLNFRGVAFNDVFCSAN